MSLLIIIPILMVVAAIIFLSGNFFLRKDKRQSYLQGLAELLETKIEPMEHIENSFQITFNHGGREFVYEDIGLEKTHQGFLRTKAPFAITVTFTEKTRGMIRSKGSSLKEISTPWMENVDRVMSPRELQDFVIFTNSPRLANLMFEDPEVVKVFDKFKNRDGRGHPVMSLEIIEGMIRLRFHGQQQLYPNTLGLQSNVSTIEFYLEKMMILAGKLDYIKSEGLL